MRCLVARVLGSEHNGVIIVARGCLDVCFHSNKKTQEKQLFAEENYEALCKTGLARQVSGLGNQSSRRVGGSQKEWRHQWQNGGDSAPSPRKWHRAGVNLTKPYCRGVLGGLWKESMFSCFAINSFWFLFIISLTLINVLVSKQVLKILSLLFQTLSTNSIEQIIWMTIKSKHG